MKDKKLEDLENKIEELKNKENTIKKYDNLASPLKLAMNLLIEFNAGILIGGFIGHYIDKILNTNPLFFITFVMLGFIAGILNVIRFAKNIDNK